MSMNNMKLGADYYKLVSAKNLEEIKKFLNQEVEFHSPLVTVKGKEAVLEVTGKFMNVFNSLTIRTKFGKEDQAMIVYDVDIPGVAKNFPGASLLTFQDGLIVKIELFYDSRPVLEKSEIFSKS